MGNQKKLNCGFCATLCQIKCQFPPSTGKNIKVQMLMGTISSNTLASSSTRSDTFVLIQRAASDNTLIHHALYSGTQNKAFKYQRADGD